MHSEQTMNTMNTKKNKILNKTKLTITVVWMQQDTCQPVEPLW